MISIIIPIYNHAEKLKKCLQSIKNQTYDNYEIIAVDDHSNDNLKEVIKYSKKEFGYKIEWFFNQKNHGAPYTRNKGFKISKGEFILFCDADIVFKKNALEVMHKTLMENNKVSYAYPSHIFGHKKFKLFSFDAEKLKKMPYIHSTALIRKTDFPKTGFDEKIKRLQDWDLWLTMLEQGHIGIWIDEILFKVSPGGTMSSWLPSFAYKLFPFLPNVKKYKKAVNIIKKKHKLIN